MKLRLFGQRREEPTEEYDRERMRPVIRASICTGEQVAGFKELQTGQFHEVCVIRSEEDLRIFMKRYGLESSDIRKEW